VNHFSPSGFFLNLAFGGEECESASQDLVLLKSKGYYHR
jgi:hypothetical protein